jgi:hypothetical protein
MNVVIASEAKQSMVPLLNCFLGFHLIANAVALLLRMGAWN